MPRRIWPLKIAGLPILVVVMAGCGGSGTTTSAVPPTISIAVTPTEAPTTSTTLDTGPQPFLSGSLLEPGEYMTTVFEPTVMYRIERKYLLRPFQNERVTGFENMLNVGISDNDPFKGVGIQNFWRGLTPDEVLEQLDDIEQIELGQETGTEIGGFPGRRIEAEVKNSVGLWFTLAGGDQGRSWFVRRGPLDIIILDTPAGTLLITINAPAEEWDEFLPIAEEILAGISFPDLK